MASIRERSGFEIATCGQCLPVPGGAAVGRCEDEAVVAIGIADDPGVLRVRTDDVVEIAVWIEPG